MAFLHYWRMSPADPRDRQAAEDQVDPDRLLEGEDPNTPQPEDARHWVETYRELLVVKERLLGTTRESMAQALDQSATREVASTDLVTLRAEHARFKRRLEFWKRRAAELEGS
jgi:hypothetical protein